MRPCLRFHSLSIALLYISLLISQSFAGKIVGNVKNAQTGKPLSGVMVEIEGGDISTLTDSTGFFRFESVPSGSFNLLFFHEKSEPLSITDIFVPGDGEKRIDAEMNPVIANLEKMVVTGHAFRRAPDMSSSTKMMNFDEILRSPGALVDVQRAVQDLPSVSSAADNTNEIIVRGGNPGENLLIMDNIEIPNPNHFADQGSGGGVISLINPLLVKGLTFNAGAPPAQYGGKASSVLDVKLREGNDKIVLGGVDLGMAGVGFHAEGPLWRGANFMASATKSYLDLFSKFADATAIPEYWGLQGKVAQNIGSQKLYANFIYGDNAIEIADASGQIGTDGDEIEAGGKVYAAGVSWEGNWGERFSTLVTLSGTGNSFERLEYSITSDDTRDTFFTNTSMEQEQTIKVQGSLDLPRNTRIQAGILARRCDFDIDIWERPDTINDSVYHRAAKSGQIAYKYGGFISGIFYPLDQLRFIPGIRVDGFTYNQNRYISPRLGLVYSFPSGIDLTGSFGIQYQDPDYADLVATKQNKNLKPPKATTGILGAEYLLKKISAKTVVETYYKQYDDLPVEEALMTPDSLDKSDVLLSVGKGRSYGIEFFIQKKLTRNFFFTAAYSLSRSEYLDPRPGRENQWYRGDFDFRNALTVTGGCKIDLIEKEWYKKVHDSWWLIALSPVIPIADRVELSAKWRYLGGRPRTQPVWNEEYQRWVLNQHDLNSSQYPDYHRLDLRFERRYGFGFLHMIYYFDLQNIYNKKNIWNYMYSNHHASETPIYQFQFFPAGGVIIGF